MSTATNKVVKAVTVAGSHPGYHQLQVDRLIKEWPILAHALYELTIEQGKRPPDEWRPTR